MKMEMDDEPESFMCPITCEMMIDPVITADGFSYERSAIEEWLKHQNTSPRTNEVLSFKTLIPNRALASQIKEWRDKQTISIPADWVVVDESDDGVIGEGGWSLVHKGTLRVGKKHVPVAIKTIPDVRTEEVAKMLETEIGNLKRASSECLYTVKFYGTTMKSIRGARSTLCIILKLYKRTLTEVISEAGKLTTIDALQYSIKLLRALAELHSIGILHRDIKPNNILVDEFGTLVIADFGISLRVQSFGFVQTAVKGTWNYMCPELFETGVPIDSKVDLWAAGCCLLQMLTGKMPFTGLQMQQIYVKVCVKREMPPEASSADIPVNIKSLIDECMQFDPQNRPTAEDMLTQLTRITSDFPEVSIALTVGSIL